jgi:hypothetical protein
MPDWSRSTCWETAAWGLSETLFITSVPIGGDFEEYGWEPEDDADTQALLAQGRTMGCFYIESPAMRLLQQKSGGAISSTW